MPVNAPGTTPASPDFEDADEAPPWPDEAFERAEIRRGDAVLRPAAGTLTRRRGSPPSSSPKRQVTLRLDADILEHFRATGPGWQGRINAALRKVTAG